MTLGSEDLNGIYAFVPIPWKKDYTLDRKILKNDIEYLSRTPVSGIYTLDSSGEFFAVGFREYKQIVDILMEVTSSVDIDVQVGCHSSNAQSAFERAKYAATMGVDGIRFSFPFWNSVTPKEGIHFAKQMAKASQGVPLIHYNNPNAKTEFGVKEYQKLSKTVPEVIGTKLLIRDPYELARLLHNVPELSHFVDESVFSQGMAGGASGMYAWLATINPELAVEWYHSCSNGDWERAMEIQTMVNQFRHITLSQWDNQYPAAIHKLNARLNPNIECPLRVRPPYESGTKENLSSIKNWVDREMPEMIDL